jgi:undecaprenyl-phosphate galactose phosphotransferase
VIAAARRTLASGPSMTAHRPDPPIPAFVGESILANRPERRRGRLDNHEALLAGDVTGLVLAFVLTAILGGSLELDGLGDLGGWLFQFLATTGFVVVWLHDRGHYDRRLPFWTEAKQIMIALALAALVDGFLQYLTRVETPRLWLIGHWMIAYAAVLPARRVVKWWLRRRGTWELPMVIIGIGEAATEAARLVRTERNMGYRVVAVVDPAEIALAPGDDCREALYHRFGAGFVLVVPDARDPLGCSALVAALTRQRLPFAVVPTTGGIAVFGLRPLYTLSHDLVLLEGRSNVAAPLPQMAKRAFDLMVTGLFLILTLPIAPFIALLVALIRIDGGPVVYRQMRVGYGGRLFPCLKFRTMVVNADQALKAHLAANPEAAAEWARDQKLRRDPRITLVGRFLRKTSLDELPQLINVLRGDMTLVGPRPIVPAEIERYGADIAYYYQVKPGITGLWQVSGRNDVDYPTRVRLDCWYVRNWTFWHDIAILFKTIPALVTGRGAC